ncbi:MAG: tRNA uridine-5-carboxymethylaminomethyl(34) synthesis GTPase MnmE [Verrucomicrobiota bacterium]|jgi:tRNA modification GTPase|nr:tRNA uridine-5-carboxymethylaminomethyl(34) synthesis GTPase MnmE [Verrucomicrobiota bacterium]
MSFSLSTDTMAAIATAPGEGAIAVVRLSGPETYALADRLFRCPSPPPSGRATGTFVHGQVCEPATGEVIDDALLLVFKAPRSYTGEDAVEIHCHGGSQSARRILDALLHAGARPAGPGEFTKRAFLNNKLDLTQAEAVLDLIHARSERAARLAAAQLENALGIRIRALYDALLAASADTEALLDFPDDELPQGVTSEIKDRVDVLSRDLRALLGTWSEGHVLRDGARIVIAGAPNVGKSTLLNRLAGRERAIVSPHAGTTRDIIEESVTLHGYPFHLSDTAGLREAPCEIEQEGIRRTHLALAEADLCLYLVDASQPLSEAETAFIRSHDPQRILVLANKTDLGNRLFSKEVADFQILGLSAQQDPSMEPLIDAMLAKLHLTSGSGHQEGVAVSRRHKDSLSIALEEITQTSILLSDGREPSFLPAATHLRSATEQVGFIFGKDCTDEMLNTLFSRFCVGK